MNIDGFSDPRFSRVKEAYETNFKNSLDVGSSLCITVAGEVVLDLWGGYKDAAQKHPWVEDTIVNVWSSTKNMTSLCALILADRKELDLHAPVADYWPEFAANGKGNVLVSHIMSHSSGLSGWEKPISYKDYYDWEKVVDLLAEQAPMWEPGSAVGYHSITVGFLVGEIIKRITGESLGNFFKKEIADPLKSDFHIGLNQEDFHRVAEIYMPGDPSTANLAEEMEEGSVAKKTMANGAMNPSCALETEWRRAEIGAAGGHGNGRSIAECMALIANNGNANGQNILSPEIIDSVFEEQIIGHDLVLDRMLRWGIGFGLPIKNDSWMGYFQNEDTCYWTGWGGSLSIADRKNNVSFGYAPIKMDEDVFGEERTNTLVQALVESIS